MSALERDGRTILSYGAGAGYTPLRALIAQWFGVHPSRVVLTNGALHGLALLARRLARGRNVVAEYPIYPRAERVLLAAEASLLGTPLDEDGMNPDEIHSMLVQYSTPAIIYTIPSFNNPTGWTLTLPRRRRLVELVAGQSAVQVQGMQIVEDDSYALTRFEGEGMQALFDLSGKVTVYLSSFSTTIAPGLRVGWLVLPEGLADDIAADAADSYITPSLLSQATVFEFITRGSFERHLGELRAGLRLRRDAMLAAIERHMPGVALLAARGRLLRLARAARPARRPRGARARAGRDGRRRHLVQRHVELAAALVRRLHARRDRRRHLAPRRGAVVSLRSLQRPGTGSTVPLSQPGATTETAK